MVFNSSSVEILGYIYLDSIRRTPITKRQNLTHLTPVSFIRFNDYQLFIIETFQVGNSDNYNRS